MIARKIFVAAFLFVQAVPFAFASQAKMDELFGALLAAPSVGEARAVERQIWAAWLKSGDAETDQLMSRAIAAMNRQDFTKSLEILGVVIARSPEYAEGWNKRATVLYLVRRYDESLADIERVLALEPRHFGAISGIALNRLAQDRKAAALAAVLRALEIYPLMPGAKALISRAGGAADPI